MEHNIKFLNCKEIFSLVLISGLLVLMAIPFQDAFAISPIWPGDFTANDGGVTSSSIPTFPVTVSVIDSSQSGLGTIEIRITSSVDPNGFDLTLNEGPPGTFTNTNLALMSDNLLSISGGSLTITILDFSNEDPFSIQNLLPGEIKVVSDSDPIGITPTFTETGLDTNVYIAEIIFGETTNSGTNTLMGQPGDIFSVYDKVAKNLASGFLNPNPNVGKGAILVELGGTVTATYGEDSSSFVVRNYPGPGRGSGGLIKPGLVLDNPSLGGACGDCAPPTLGIDKNNIRIVNNGFSFNNNPVDVNLFYTPYPLITTNVGQENIVVLKIFDDGGIENIEHVSLAYGLGHHQSFNESVATINLDKTFGGKELISVYDPENALDNVKIVTSQDRCSNNSKTQCLVVTIYHIFREDLEFNMVATNVWDTKKNAWQNFYNHGIEVKGESLNPPKTKMIAFGERDMVGLFELKEINKKKHLWIDEFGNIYEDRGNDYFERIFSVPKEIVFDKNTTHGCDRNCNWFYHYKLNQELLAEKTLEEMLDGKTIKGEPGKEPFSHSYKMTNRSDDPELQKSIIAEQIRAQKMLNELLSP